VLRRAAADAAERAPWLIDGYRAVRNPRWEVDLWRDLAATRRSVAWLRQQPALPASAPVALLGLYRDNVYETKLGLVLLTALRLRGLEPVVLMPNNRAHRIRRYAKAYGVSRVLTHSSIAPTPVERAEIDRQRAELMRGPLDFDSIKTWEFRGYAIGNHVLSTLIRTTFDGSPDLALAHNRGRVDAILDEVLINTARDERVIDEIRPAVVLVEEANYSTNGPLVDVAVSRGVDVIQTVGIWRDDALMSKRLTEATRRVDAKSVAPETLARVEAGRWTPAHDKQLDQDFADRYSGRWVLGQQFQPDTESATREQIVAETGVDPERPTAVIFAHVLWDASLFFGVDLFENYADWLVQSVRAAVENPRVNWVIKAHPSNVFRKKHGDVGGESSEVVLIREHFPELPDHVHLLLPHTRISTLSLYEFADYGVTVRGTPGMEMACLGKPAFTAGTGTYAGLGFTYDSDSREAFLDKLARIDSFGPLPDDMRMRARQYAHTLFLRRPWLTRSFDLRFDLPDEGWHPIDRNVVTTAAGVADVEARGDLGSWSNWALESRDSDYLSHDLWTED
jgi:hypothetical protein